eukprot:scaffold6240_cov59-Attheya_sp.AAC.5
MSHLYHTHAPTVAYRYKSSKKRDETTGRRAGGRRGRRDDSTTVPARRVPVPSLLDLFTPAARHLLQADRTAFVFEGSKPARPFDILLLHREAFALQ